MRGRIGSSNERHTLGMGADITRRDFVGGTLIGAGAMLMGAPSPAAAQDLTAEWNGYTGIGDCARSNGNPAAVVNAAHGIRDQLYEDRLSAAPLVDDLYDLVIVGGGFAGLIAAYDFRKAHPDKACLILENHPVFGGEAKQNEIRVGDVTLTGPQGSSEAVLPAADNRYAHVSDLWDEIGLPRSYRFVAPTGGAASMQFTSDVFDRVFPHEYTPALGYFFDTPFAAKRGWITDPWSDDLKRAPIPARTRDDWVKWKKHAPMVTRGDAAATDRWLDSISYGDLLTRTRAAEGHLPPDRSLHRDRQFRRRCGCAVGLCRKDHGAARHEGPGAAFARAGGDRRDLLLPRRQHRDPAPHRQGDLAGRHHRHTVVRRHLVRADRFCGTGSA